MDDAGATNKQTDCERIADAKRVDLKGPSDTCVSSLLESCTLGCAMSRNKNENREHFYMLMTSPPP